MEVHLWMFVLSSALLVVVVLVVVVGRVFFFFGTLKVGNWALGLELQPESQAKTWGLFYDRILKGLVLFCHWIQSFSSTHLLEIKLVQ